MSEDGGDLSAFGLLIWEFLKFPIAILFTIAFFIFPEFPALYVLVFWVLACLPLDNWLPDWFWELFTAAIVLGFFFGVFYLLVLTEIIV